MYQSNTPENALILFDTASASATAVSGVTWAKTGLTYIDLQGIGQLSFQTAGTYSLTLQFQVSNDLTNWANCPMQNSAAVPIAENINVTGSANNVFDIPVRGWRYFRINVSAYVSGTITFTIYGRPGAAAPSTQPVFAGQDTNPWLVLPTAPLPSGATAINGASGNVANANAVATLAGASSKTTYITGFEITAAGATAAASVIVAITGTKDTTLSYIFTVPAGAILAADPLVVEFPYPIPASATNTSIVVTCPALGAGNTNAAAVAHGFQL